MCFSLPSSWHWQISGETVGEVRAVADMHQRKAEMARQSDAFVALPGMVTATIHAVLLLQVLLVDLHPERDGADGN
jgi:hypothetical protein